MRQTLLCKQVQNLDKNTVYKKLTSSKFGKFIPNYIESKYVDAPEMPLGEYYKPHPSHEGIFYDKYRNVYFRLALLPGTKLNINYNEKDAPLKHISVIV